MAAWLLNCFWTLRDGEVEEGQRARTVEIVCPAAESVVNFSGLPPSSLMITTGYLLEVAARIADSAKVKVTKRFIKEYILNN